MKLHCFYWSATGNSKAVAESVVEGIDPTEVVYYNLFSGIGSQVKLSSGEVALFSVPVYSGRIPGPVVEAIEHISGQSTPAIILCSYGNRAYDDALVELNATVVGAGFQVLSAAACVAQHSIFNHIATGRPDTQDRAELLAYGQHCRYLLESDSALLECAALVNRPYRAIKPIPFNPTTKSSCNQCGLCVKECPSQALGKDCKTIDVSKCLVCGHCISVCPKQAKGYKGFTYWLASQLFAKKYSVRQSNVFLLQE